MITIGPSFILGFVCICFAIGIYCAVADMQDKIDKERKKEEYEKKCIRVEDEFNFRLKWKDPVLYSKKEVLDKVYDMGRMTEREYKEGLNKILNHYKAQEVLKEMEDKRKIKRVLENSRDWRNYR